MRKEKGIVLTSLVLVIVLMGIIASTVIYSSLESFEINKVRKMMNDIELLTDKVKNYYLKYGELPVLEKYSSGLSFARSSVDNSNYFIINLNAMEGISLNYGKQGFEAPNSSDDVYIVNEKSHVIYYVRGVELDGVIYHTINEIGTTDNINIPPTKPQINVIYGEKIGDYYYTDIELEFVPGINKLLGIYETTYSIEKDGVLLETRKIGTLTNNVYTITGDGSYVITIKTYDNNGGVSTTTQTFIKQALS